MGIMSWLRKGNFISILTSAKFLSSILSWHGLGPGGLGFGHVLLIFHESANTFASPVS